MSKDQQHGCGHPGCKGSHRDRRGEPVIAVNDGDREEGADCLQDQTCPLNQIDFGSAGENALATRIQRAFKRGGDLTLCGLLAQVAGPESKKSAATPRRARVG